MKKTTTAARSNPVADDPEVVAFRAQFDERSPLDEIVRTGAQQMLQAAIDAEVADFLAQHAGRCDENGNRLVVRNGYHPERELLTGAGRLEVRQPRVRDNTAAKDNRVTFSPSVLPPYPNHFVGEMSFMTGNAASADTRPAGHVRVHEWPQHKIRELEDRNPLLYKSLLAVLGCDLASKLQRTAASSDRLRVSKQANDE